MDRSKVAYLVTETYQKDDIGQRIPVQTLRKIFCSVESVTRAEWSAAGEQGIKPECVMTMFGPDYHGEKVVMLDDQLYGIYRTYRGRNDTVELYLEWKVGNSNDPDVPEAVQSGK